ncbi:MAG: hypothetical protein EOO77_28210 [Oxalobacteraceae bacterium]|nr:MAG: hypothetical protein EOO77_28210 [Oxalobacteraceae bacterium]
MLTVACVYKTFSNGSFGGAYDDSWVQKLQHGVSRHLSVPHEFVCLSDSFVPGVTVAPLRNDWEGWWSKIELFRPSLFRGPVLSFDLDVMITGTLDEFAGPFPNMVMLRDIIPTISNSTCMWWDASNPAYGDIYTRFRTDPDGFKRHHHLFNTQTMGDQGFITDTMKAAGVQIDLWQDVLDPKRFEYFSAFSAAHMAYLDNPTKPETSLVYCLGKPKFNNFSDHPHVQTHWI